MDGIAAKPSEKKILICHFDQASGTYKQNMINLFKWPAHQQHGDVRLDDQDNDGYVPNNACGFGQMGDCDDNDATLNPGATEICSNAKDDNCNGNIDENCEITICDQTWMGRNLDVSTYRNGDAIPQVTDPTEWANLTTGAWCYYNNNPATGAIYGKLYNWFAVNDPRGLAPAGWHIPTDPEWTTLADCLGGWPVAGGNMKVTGTTHWMSPNTDATNSSGFTALPAGVRLWVGQPAVFDSLSSSTNWWSATQTINDNAMIRALSHDHGYLVRFEQSDNNAGLSVRCVKD